MAKRILFVPWPRGMGELVEEYTTFETNLRQLGPHQRYHPIRLKDPDLPRTSKGLEYRFKNRKWIEAIKSSTKDDKDIYQVWYDGRINIILLGAGSTDRIYIRGHSEVNTPHIFSKSMSSPDPGILTAVEVADRLVASGLLPGFRGVIKCYNCHSAEGPKCFAGTFARELYGRGYTQCTYYGYEGALDSFATEGTRKTSLFHDVLYRAKDRRIQIHPEQGG